MKTTIRLAGAQIPVTPYTQSNVMEIRRAIDWASENNVDYLITPEASLSGYTADFDNNFNRTTDGLAEIEKYAAAKNVGYLYPHCSSLHNFLVPMAQASTSGLFFYIF